jgi:hypothetical protein
LAAVLDGLAGRDVQGLAAHRARPEHAGRRRASIRRGTQQES